MRVQFRATKVATRKVTSVGGGGHESEHELLDVRLEPVAGESWRGSPAGTVSFTFDDPSAFGFWQEGRTYEFAITGG